MQGNEWVFTTLAIMIGAHLMILTYAFVLRRNAAAFDEGDGEGQLPAEGGVSEDDVCRCADCGAVNELGYRFCKYCIAELPTQSALGQRNRRRSNPS